MNSGGAAADSGRCVSRPPERISASKPWGKPMSSSELGGKRMASSPPPWVTPMGVGAGATAGTTVAVPMLGGGGALGGGAAGKKGGHSDRGGGVCFCMNAVLGGAAAGAVPVLEYLAPTPSPRFEGTFSGCDHELLLLRPFILFWSEHQLDDFDELHWPAFSTATPSPRPSWFPPPFLFLNDWLWG